MQVCSYIDAIKQAEQKLKHHQQETYPASLLMEDLFGMDRTQLMLHGTGMMTEQDVCLYREMIDKVALGMPYQYVVGFSWFYGEKFEVDKNVLIPRNETEELVEKVLKDVCDDGKVVADIGTGSGVIPVSLKKHWYNNSVVATDISKAALSVARKNSTLHETDVLFLRGDLFEPLIKEGLKVDVVVSNPPYIAHDEVALMTASTIQHEPSLALFAEDSGLALYKQMIDRLPDVLKEKGRVYFEIGFRQGDALKHYIKSVWPDTEPEIELDINRNPRILHFTWER